MFTATEKRIKKLVPNPVDSAGKPELASSLVRICSSDIHAVERGLLPKINEKRMLFFSCCGRQRDTRQDVNRFEELSFKGKLFKFDFRIFLKMIRGIPQTGLRITVFGAKDCSKGLFIHKNILTPTEAA